MVASTGFLQRQLSLVAAVIATAASLTVMSPTWAADPAGNVWPENLKGHGGPVKSVTLAPDGKRLLSTSFDYSARLWIYSGEAKMLLEPLVLIGHDAAVNDARFLPDNRAASVSDDSSLIVWDLASGNVLHRFAGLGEKVLSLEVSASGRYAAVASWENQARVYDLGADEPGLVASLESHRNNVNAVVFSPEETHVFTASTDGGVRRFDLASNTLEREIFSLGWGVNALKMLTDGRTLVYGGADGTVGLLDAETGFDLGQLKQHSRPVLALAVSPDGAHIASGGGDGLIRVYDRESQRLLEQFETPYGPVWGLAFTQDGSSLFYTGLDDTIHRWQVAPRKAFEPLEVAYPRRFQVADEDDPGALQFARKCSVCHTLTPDGGNRAGPTLYGVFGREAGTLKGYPYSEALLKSDIIWSEETIALLFDHGPDVYTPGSKMPMQRMRSADDRKALVTFLKKATKPFDPGSVENRTTGDTNQ
ncbi:c-type cytochrome [Roseibium sp.]|uniref:c-type cytochrome n=1 Tax=Roseibium sp. TaxID=1936156 RepID=UPI003A981624